MSTNPPNFRIPLRNLEGKAHEDVVKAITFHDNAINDLQQAIPLIMEKIKALQAEQATK